MRRSFQWVPANCPHLRVNKSSTPPTQNPSPQAEILTAGNGEEGLVDGWLTQPRGRLVFRDELNNVNILIRLDCAFFNMQKIFLFH
jgi:hypothetical protein